MFFMVELMCIANSLWKLRTHICTNLPVCYTNVFITFHYKLWNSSKLIWCQFVLEDTVKAELHYKSLKKVNLKEQLIENFGINIITSIRSYILNFYGILCNLTKIGPISLTTLNFLNLIFKRKIFNIEFHNILPN